MTARERNERFEPRTSTPVSPVLLLLAGLLTAFPAIGAEYFVNKFGNDAHDGRTVETAFPTIQKGVDALEPGDTLTIGPGEYSENVKRDNLGGPDTDTTIRAEMPGTVLLRGDVPLPAFKKVDGYRFVYATQFDPTPEAVLEHDTLRILPRKPNVTEVEFAAGAFHHDAGSKTLYLSSSDQKEPARHRYSAAVNGQNGLLLRKPTRVVMEGIAATGSYRETPRAVGKWLTASQWGIGLEEPVDCVVRDCVTFLNYGGIALERGTGNVVEGCKSFGNVSCNIEVFGGVTRNVIRNCYAYKAANGIHHYTGMAGPTLMKNNVTWGHRHLEYSMKGGRKGIEGDIERFGLLENCVGLGGDMRIKNMSRCVIRSGRNEYRRDIPTPIDNIILDEEENLDLDREFADPINMDFRLQGDSRFRGSSWEGKDRGAFPDFRSNVFYLSPDGKDDNRGLSVRAAWKSLDLAVGKLRPGDTLYLQGGEYQTGGPFDLGRAGAERVLIRGRGRDRVVIKGKLELSKGAEVTFERLHFADRVDLRDGENLELRNCVFAAPGCGLSAEGVKNIRITHSLFADAPLRLERTTGAFLSGNIYANRKTPALMLDDDAGVKYSDYNSYEDPSRCWEVGRATRTLAEVQKQNDRYSLLAVPELALDQGPPYLGNAHVFNGRGPLGTSLGVYQEFQETTHSLTGPVLHNVSATTANIEWWSSANTLELAWGETPAMESTAINKNIFRYATFSLKGLRPGTKYYFKLRSIPTADSEGTKPGAERLPDTPTLTFTTAGADPEPVTYYVAPDGEDTNTGLNREAAFRTITRAAAQVNVGDTVLVAGGTYNEFPRVRATGIEGKPITFKAMPGEKVILDGVGRSLSQAIAVVNKDYINIDGIYFSMYSGPLVYLYRSDHVRITRCFARGRGPGYAGPLAQANHCRDLLVKNCIMTEGMGGGLELNGCPDARIEHNLFLRNLIYACILVNDPEQKISFRKNIVCDSLPYKVRVQLFEIGRVESFAEEENCYFLRWPDEKRKMFMFYGTEAYDRAAKYHGLRMNFEKPPVFKDLVRIGLGEYQEQFGNTGSLVMDPKFRGTLGMEPGGKLWTGDPAMMFDKLLGKEDLDFPDAFATEPKVVEKKIGLIPEDFEDFWFNKKE